MTDAMPALHLERHVKGPKYARAFAQTSVTPLPSPCPRVLYVTPEMAGFVQAGGLGEADARKYADTIRLRPTPYVSVRFELAEIVALVREAMVGPKRVVPEIDRFRCRGPAVLTRCPLSSGAKCNPRRH